MEVLILGNGGAISDGLVYNSFLLDGRSLVEVPPDIVSSLFTQGISIPEIDTIFLSHFHGDHCFGFPFLALRQFFDGIDTTTRMIGPAGLRERMMEITVIAFGERHPVVRWIRDHYEFIEIKKTGDIQVLGDYQIQAIPMIHGDETWGFKILEKNNFIYLADSRWDESLLPWLKEEAQTVLIDLNGEKGEEPQIHTSEYDIVEHVLPHTDIRTVFLGTHLKSAKLSSQDRIRYVNPGDRFSIRNAGVV